MLITSLRTTPEALPRQIRQRWSMENEWHWARATQLGEDDHRYANRTGVAVFSFLRTIVMLALGSVTRPDATIGSHFLAALAGSGLTRIKAAPPEAEPLDSR